MRNLNQPNPGPLNHALPFPLYSTLLYSTSTQVYSTYPKPFGESTQLNWKENFLAAKIQLFIVIVRYLFDFDFFWNSGAQSFIMVNWLKC